MRIGGSDDNFLPAKGKKKRKRQANGNEKSDFEKQPGFYLSIGYVCKQFTKIKNSPKLRKVRKINGDYDIKLIKIFFRSNLIIHSRLGWLEKSFMLRLESSTE